MAGAPANLNLAGLAKADYRGNPTTLCQGCGHNSISNQIIAAMYEMSVLPENVIKFSGIGCSSKSPTYFMNRSFSVCTDVCHLSPPADCLATTP
jgi:2-oxoglutarate ferredoxin oxidoreductase subunit beta